MYYPPVENSILRNIMSRLEKISHQHIICILLFLLPVFTITVRHWLSSLFGILAIYSLVYLLRRKLSITNLHREEKILLWAFGIYFLVFLLTSFVNGWGEPQTRYVGKEIRFLMFIPIYLLVRQVPDAAKWLLLGMVCCLIFTIWGGIDAVVFQGERRYFSIYGPLFTGPVAVLMAVSLIPYLDKVSSMKGKLFISSVIVVSAIPVILTDARSAYFAVPILIIIAFLKTNGIKRYIIPLLVIFVSVVLYMSVERVSKRIDYAYAEYAEYMSVDDPVRSIARLSSTGVRLEMWRVTPHFVRDNPVFGVGRGNYVSAVDKYIKARKAHKDIAEHSHPHNIFSEMLISKGIVGLLAFLGITLLPLGMLVRNFKKHSNSAIYGILLITGFLFFSVADASTFIKGNYIALYIIFLSVFFSYHIQEREKKTE